MNETKDKDPEPGDSYEKEIADELRKIRQILEDLQKAVGNLDGKKLVI
ncbi:MAG: hypothetical protein KatS3mg054_0140 [Chloroflexus sp.]|nr:MAG: hypothetical protein KatS3mg054_0140 [Chloroflexus sp.]